MKPLSWDMFPNKSLQRKTRFFEVVENMPEFPGGMGGLMQYLSKNIKYPVEAQKAGIQGRVTMQVIIDKNGNVTNPKVTQPVDPLIGYRSNSRHRKYA